MVGCSLLQKTVYIPVESKRDSVVVERLVVDTVRFDIPGDTVFVVGVDSSHLETRWSISDARIESDGRLFHRLINKDVSIEKEIVTKEVEKKVEVEKEVPVEVEVPVKYVPGYYRWMERLFYGLLGIFVIFIVVKLRRL